MSVFGPNQVEELIVGNAVATETNVTDFVANASVGEVKAVNQNGGAVVEGEKFKFLQKTDGNAGKNLNYEFSDVITPSKVKKVTVKEYSAEVQKEVTVGNYVTASIVADSTYILETRILADGGSLSPENFAIVSGYHQTGANDTAETVATGLAQTINQNLKRRGDNELTVVAQEDSGNAGEWQIIITAKEQVAVPGKIEGRPIQFEVNHKIYDSTDPTSSNVNNVDVEVTTDAFPGTGTGKYAVNLEWFTKGYKYEPYRQTGYPADFTERTPYYASQSKTYNVIHVHYFMDRESPTVENQNKVLTALIERTNLASNAATNDVLDELRAALGSASVPADLPVI